MLWRPNKRRPKLARTKAALPVSPRLMELHPATSTVVQLQLLTTRRSLTKALKTASSGWQCPQTNRNLGQASALDMPMSPRRAAITQSQATVKKISEAYSTINLTQ